MSHYALLDNVKLALRLQDADESLSEELEKYLTDADTWINRKIRNRVGEIDIHGNPIELPLTEETAIPIDDDIIQNAVDLAVGKFRKEQNNEDLLWENAKENFESYLDDRFGWGSEENFRVDNPTTISYSPVDILLAGSIVTIQGTNYHQFKKLQFEFAGQVVVTSPATVFASQRGKFSGVKFTIPDTLTESKAYELNARDGDENQDNRASTFISVNVDTGTNFNYLVDAITLGTLLRAFPVDGILLGTMTNNFSTDAILT